ncbi:MAG: efflux RND transporter periplasmic adaptor subunit [Bacteroidota bacterium]|nr:efflux RND transporter periplasmic adaptor subunit [Bacteroidota bacterium]
MSVLPTQRMNPMNRNFLILLSSSVLVAVLVSGCGASPEAAASTDSDRSEETATQTPDAGVSNSRTVRVSTLRVEPGVFEEIVPLTGSVTAPQDASLSAQTAGTLIELVSVGTQVDEGAVVARLDDRLIRAGLEQARANLTSSESQFRLAEETYRRQEPLYRDSIISALEWEGVTTQRNQARSVLAQAEAAVAQAEQQLEYTFVRAPFPGTVEERFAERGEQVMPGSPIARVVNTRSLKVVAGVPETYAADIRRGTPVYLSFRAYADGDRDAVVSFVGSVINPQNRTFPAEVEIDNPSGVLKPAMIADVKLTRRVLEDRIIIPQTAILRDENGSSVYVATPSGNGHVADRRAIELGPSYNGRTVVDMGLSTGDLVITAGQTSVAEGDAVVVSN